MEKSKSFKVTTDSEHWGELYYRVGANSREEAQRILIENFPSIEDGDGDPYGLPPGKDQMIDYIEELKGQEFVHGKAERIYPKYE